MKQRVSVKEMKIIQQEILAEVADFCDKNSIEYFLAFGTLLGAVRHRGYIPWDDDIDIYMTRENYNRFLASYKGTEHHSLLNIHTNEQCFYLYSKVIDTRTELYEPDVKIINGYGVYMDIFPMDRIPDDPKERARFIRRCWLYKKMIFLYCDDRPKQESWAKKIIKKILLRLLDWRRICRKADRYFQKCGSGDRGSYTSLTELTENRLEYCLPASVMQERIRFPFENGEYWSHKEYDSVLKTLYGDYMKLPPENERQVHDPTVYWRDGFAP